MSEHITTQHIALEGQPGFRDLGGYQTADGRTVKSGLRSLFYVDPSYFEAMLDEVDQQHGSFESYLEDGLGIDPARLAYLQQQFTD